MEIDLTTFCIITPSCDCLPYLVLQQKVRRNQDCGVKKKTSATENWTRVSCVTGRDNDHYTIADQLNKTIRFWLNETLTIYNGMY